MSKPDPSITANLLNRLMEPKTEAAEGGTVPQNAAKKTSEASPKPGAAKSKLGPSRKAPTPGHMRSSPRGK